MRFSFCILPFALTVGISVPAESQVNPSNGATAIEFEIILEDGSQTGTRYELPSAPDGIFIIKVPTAKKPTIKGFLNIERSFAAEYTVFTTTTAKGGNAKVEETTRGLRILLAPQSAVNAINQPPVREITETTPPPTSTPELLAESSLPVNSAAGSSRPEDLIAKIPGVSDSKAVQDNYSHYSLDLSIPESPAFAVLGLTPDSVIRPSSPRELAAALVNGVDRNGHLQNGVSVDTVPYLLLAGQKVTLGKYRQDKTTRLLSRTQFSLATTKGSDQDDKSVRLALGLHVALMDKGDPRLDETLSKCLENETDEIFISPVPPVPKNVHDAEVDRRQNLLRSKVEKCRAQARSRNWNRSSWLVGLAPSFISINGDSSGLRSNGQALWTSYAYGFEGVPILENRAQLILHGRYFRDEQVPDANNPGQFLRQNSRLFGARLRFGNERLAGSLETTFTRAKRQDGIDENIRRVALGGDFKLSKDMWLVVSVGGEGGRKDGKDNTFVLGNLKFATESEPSFSPRNGQ